MNVIHSFIETAESEAKAKAEAERAQQEHLAQVARREVDSVIKNVLGEVGTGTFEAENGKRLVRGWRKILVDEMDSFYVVAEQQGGSNREFTCYVTDIKPTERRNYYPHRHEKVIEIRLAPGNVLPDTVRVALGQFFRAQQIRYLEQVKDQEKQEELVKQARIKEIENLFRYHRQSVGFPQTVETADAIFAKLHNLSPERDEEWDTLRQRWEEQFELLKQDMVEAREKKDEQARLRAEYKAAKETYQTEFAAYWAEKERIYAVNLDRFEALQARWESPFTIYYLTYALVATDKEEGERYLETKTVTCLHPADGEYHRVIRFGKVTLVKYAHEVSQTAPVEVRPGDTSGFGIDVGVFTGVFEQEIRYPPDVDCEAVARDIADTFEPVPTAPNAPEILAYNDVRTIEGRIKSDDPDYTYSPNNYW